MGSRPSHVILDAHDDYILGMAYAPELEQIASAYDQGVKLCAQTTPCAPTPTRQTSTPTIAVPQCCMGRGVDASAPSRA